MNKANIALAIEIANEATPEWFRYRILDCPWSLGQTVYVRNDPTVTDEPETVGVVTGLRYLDGWGWQVFITNNEPGFYAGQHEPIDSHTPGNKTAWESDDADLSATSWAVSS